MQVYHTVVVRIINAVMIVYVLCEAFVMGEQRLTGGNGFSDNLDLELSSDRNYAFTHTPYNIILPKIELVVENNKY